MRLCNADVDEAERNPAQFEDFDELNEDDEGGPQGDAGSGAARTGSLL